MTVVCALFIKEGREVMLTEDSARPERKLSSARVPPPMRRAGGETYDEPSLH